MIHPTRQLSSTYPWSKFDVPGSIVGVVLAITLGKQRHVNGTLAAQSHIQQGPLIYMSRNSCTWTCIVLGCQLTHCLAQILLYKVGQSPTSLMMSGHPKAWRLLLVSPSFSPLHKDGR
ncbi:uncharacterized protein TNCV_3808981 [Trichonephila clavipes]|nr:uncharacterized protein TNCV_3808981 [Trichonephila clavipes]